MMENPHTHKVGGGRNQNVSGSRKFPRFPQPPHERPPSFPALEKKWTYLDDPVMRSSTRKHEIEEHVLLESLFEFHRPTRHKRLSRLLKDQNNKRVVLVMMVNCGFMPMFANWVRACDAHGIDPRAWSLVFVLDSESAGEVEQLGFSVFHDEQSYGAQPKEAVAKIGNREFKRLMFAKTAIVQDVLLLGYHVLFQDVDMIWKKDPLNYILHPSRQKLDVQFMYDGPSRHYEPLHANSGFFFLRNTMESRFFWNMVFKNYDKILHYGGQQKVVNIVLLSRLFRGLNIDILPEKDFANGHLFCEGKRLCLPKDPYVIHCSWTDNIQHKIKKFKNAGLWYL